MARTFHRTHGVLAKSAFRTEPEPRSVRLLSWRSLWQLDAASLQSVLDLLVLQRAHAAAFRRPDRFYRSDAGRTRDHGGTGLGLAIVASLVEAHGGTVTCTSSTDGGSTFCVSLPHADAS